MQLEMQIRKRALRTLPVFQPGNSWASVFSSAHTSFTGGESIHLASFLHFLDGLARI